MHKILLFAVLALFHSNMSYGFIDPFDFFDPMDKLLENNVKRATIQGIDTTVIDYLSWQRNPLHQVAMNKLRNADTEKLYSVEKKLAFWINAYNLLAIDLIIQNKEQESITNIGGIVADPWRKTLWQIGDKKYNLYNIEYKELRLLQRPRYHFALSCVTLSCPDLRTKTYRYINIYSQLEEQAKAFINNPTKGMVIVPSKKEDAPEEIRLSAIFRKFKKDFAQGKLENFLIRYVDLQDRLVTEDYLKQNWNLNTVPGRAPR